MQTHKYFAAVRWPAADGEPRVEVLTTITSKEAVLVYANHWADDKLHPGVRAEARIEYLGKNEW